jgi:putative addiction module CopG family antidote
MEAMTIKITHRLMQEIDSLIEEGWYSSRSEAVRDAVRELVERRRYQDLKKAVESDIEWGLYGE